VEAEIARRKNAVNVKCSSSTSTIVGHQNEDEIELLCLKVFGINLQKKKKLKSHILTRV
jgi:hypothetical protein